MVLASYFPIFDVLVFPTADPHQQENYYLCLSAGQDSEAAYTPSTMLKLKKSADFKSFFKAKLLFEF